MSFTKENRYYDGFNLARENGVDLCELYVAAYNEYHIAMSKPHASSSMEELLKEKDLRVYVVYLKNAIVFEYLHEHGYEFVADPDSADRWKKDSCAVSPA